MSGLSLNDADRLALAAAGVSESPDGSLRSAGGSIVSPGVAAALIARKDRLGGDQARPATHPVDPGDFRRGYIAAGHAADSPANRRLAAPVPPEGGGRSASLCTTPDDGDDVAADGDEVEKVIEAQQFARGPLIQGHEAPSPGDLPGNNRVPAVTGSGAEMYAQAAEAYNANARQARADQVMPSQACTSQPAVAAWSPPAGLGAANVPQPRAAGATQKAPGE